MFRRLALSLLGLLPPAAGAAAQDPVVTEERVRETVAWLAADERAGRGTGSPELVAAGDWIAARFAAAGLEPVGGSHRHEFPLTGWLLDSQQVRLVLVRAHGDDRQRFVLEPDRDVRQARVGDAESGVDEACTVGPGDEPAMQRLLAAGASRRLVVCEVPDDHADWLGAAGSHRVLGTKRQASRPLLLVRAGLLPPPPPDGSEVAWTATWSVGPPEKVDVPQYNVLGLRRGGEAADEYVVVSAHYDHLGPGQPVDGDRIYNGADDNATGTTGVLLVAEALAKGPAPRRSVLFVCFTAEERGLLGSAAFCARPPVPLEAVVANLNLEMLGRPPEGAAGQAWITGADLSDFAGIAGPALRRAGVELVEFPLAGQLFAASDNWSFARHGIVAHSVSAGSLHRDYHQPSDEVDRLDLAHLTRIVRGLCELTRELADRDQPPQWNERGRKRLERVRR